MRDGERQAQMQGKMSMNHIEAEVQHIRLCGQALESFSEDQPTIGSHLRRNAGKRDALSSKETACEDVGRALEGYKIHCALRYDTMK